MDLRTETLRDGSTAPAVDDVRTVTVDATSGDFSLLFGNRQTFNLEVQTIAANASSGQFTVKVRRPDGGEVSVTIDLASNLRTIQNQFWGAYASHGVSVTRQGNVFTLTFGGDLAGMNIAPIAWQGGVSATVATITDGGTPRFFAHDASAEDLQAALQLLFDPNNTDPDLPHTHNVAVTRIGNVFLIFFQGALAGPDVHPVITSVNRTDGTITVATRTQGINYYNAETLNIELGSGNDVFNVRGTSARTNLKTHDGDDRIYVSSDANLTTDTTTDFLTGNLDAVNGMLNIRAGRGRQVLMISDEASQVADNVLITDTTNRALALDPAVPGSAAEIAAHPNVPQGKNHIPDTDTEIYIVGLAHGAITYSADKTSGNYAGGVTIWSGFGGDTIDIDGTHLRSGVRTVTTLNTGLGDDTVKVNLTQGQDGFFVLNTQGPYNDRPTVSDRDKVDASTSTLPLVIFGGQDRDTIQGGQNADIIFGDRGRVYYRDAQNTIVTVLGNGGPGDKTDGVIRPPSLIFTVDDTIGGNDTIDGSTVANATLNDADVIFGGGNDDRPNETSPETIRGSEDNDILFGDYGSITLSLGLPTLIESTSTRRGGNDTINGNDGNDIVVGGFGNDTIFGDKGQDILYGDNSRTFLSNGSVTSATTIEPTVGGNDIDPRQRRQRCHPRRQRRRQHHRRQRQRYDPRRQRPGPARLRPGQQRLDLRPVHRRQRHHQRQRRR